MPMMAVRDPHWRRCADLDFHGKDAVGEMYLSEPFSLRQSHVDDGATPGCPAKQKQEVQVDSV